MQQVIRVIIPAFNEEKSVGKVINDIPNNLVKEVIIIDNGSTDATYEMIKQAGATALKEERKGYGSACLKGIDYINQLEDSTDIVVFMDADYSDYPEEMPELIKPIIENDYDIVIGSRALGNKEKGSMTPQQIFGNWLATRILKLFYNVNFTDLGPFRAIKLSKLNALGMKDTNYGWTVEMQIRAAKNKLRSTEVPVNYKMRIGVSKVSGTVKGTIMAGYKIIWTLLRYAF